MARDIAKKNRAKRDHYWRHRERLLAEKKASRLANLEKERAQDMAYHLAHREQRLAAMRAYRLLHKEARRAYEQANRDKFHNYCRDYRARKYGAPQADLTRAQWNQIKDAFKHCCAYCGKKQKRLTQDHITPLSQGGSHTLHNVVPACSSCNSRKRAGAVLAPVQPLLL